MRLRLLRIRLQRYRLLPYDAKMVLHYTGIIFITLIVLLGALGLAIQMAIPDGPGFLGLSILALIWTMWAGNEVGKIAGKVLTDGLLSTLEES